MIKALQNISPLIKLSFILSLIILAVWVIPTMVSFYKNEKIYTQKADHLASLDHRVGVQPNTKPFHTEVFKTDAEEIFNQVNVTSTNNDAYEVTITMSSDKIGLFYPYLENLSLNYAVVVENKIAFEESNNSYTVKLIVKPY